MPDLGAKCCVGISGFCLRFAGSPSKEKKKFFSSEQNRIFSRVIKIESVPLSKWVTFKISFHSVRASCRLVMSLATKIVAPLTLF